MRHQNLRLGSRLELTLQLGTTPRQQLLALFADWPGDERRRALVRVEHLLAGRQGVTLRLTRRGRYLRVRDTSTGLQACLNVPSLL